MENSIISEGKTTNEAIEKGLKKLGVSKEKVEIKVLENEEKRSFFSILAPRVVKVSLTLKENKEEKKNKTVKAKKEIKISQENQAKAKENIEKFLNKFLKQISEEIKYTIDSNENNINIKMESDEIGFLIGYRGETLYSLQNILMAVAVKGIDDKVRVILDIQGYREKRKKTLENLAEKVAKTVLKTGKPVKLEPMQAYERKIIHSKLQDNPKITTTSIGEEPHRRIVISLKK